MDKRLKYLSCDTIKALEENIGRKISDIPRSNILTDTSPKARDIKERINKWDYINIKSFCTAKEYIHKMQREPTIRENILVNDTLDKCLISKIYKELTQPYSRNTTTQLKNGQRDLKRHFSQEEIQRSQRYMKRCSASLAIREMQIKTTMSYHFTPVGMAIINKSTHKCW